MRIGTMKWLVLLLVLAVSVSLMWAQSTNSGTIVGNVTDQSGAVVGGATVTLTQTGTGTNRSAQTNDAGRYVFVNVDPGQYNVTVTKQGFSTAKASAEVQVGLTNTINVGLQVGTTNTVVEVQGAGNDLQTMNATVGNTITSAAIDALPSLGRDVSTFVEMQPGVSPDGSVAGTVNDQTYFSLDGGNNTNDMDGNMSTYTGTYAGDPTGVASQNVFYLTGQPTGVMPTPQDSVEEFKVNTANQTADFNSSSGAEVKVVTKRGTNAWHGTGYEYYRDNNWSANTWDNNFNNLPLPTFHYSRFGGAIGGPLIPKEILGGKTYFFANYEGFRFPNSITVNRDVPSPALRLGLLTDPTSGTVYNLNPTAVTFNGTTYAPSANCNGLCDPRNLGLNPTISQIWNKYEPQSNASCVNSLCDGVNVLGFTGNVSVPETSNFGVLRLDHDFSSKWHFMSSYRYYNLKNATTDQVDIGGFFSGDSLGVPTSQSNDPQQAWYWVAGLTTNITSNTTNDFHYSFLRNWWSWSRAGDTPQLAGLGGALEIFSGESATQDLSPYNVNTQQTRTRFWDGHDQMFRDDLSMLKGNHLFQFGGQYQHNFNWHQRTDNGGGINYQPVYQLGVGSSGSGLATDPAFCGFDATSWNCPSLFAAATGIVSISQIAYTRSGSNLALNPPLTPAFDQSTIPYYNVYFSDTWHLKPTFTLTYGLGWTLEMPPVEANGKQVELVDGANQLVSVESYLHSREAAALQGQVYNPTVGFTLVGNAENGRKYPYDPFYGEFSPRLAAAWNPHFDNDSVAGKIFGHDATVVRGGYGRVYGRLNGVDLVLVPLLGTGLIQPVQCFNNAAAGTCASSGLTAGGTTPAFRIGIDGNNAPIPTPSATLPQPDYPGINAIAAGAGEALDPHFRPNVVDSFDFTIQRQLSRKLTLELGYIGRRITHEYLPININAVPYMMTMGGQQFQTAYKNVVLQYCGGLAGMGGGGCAATAGAVTPQPFFEAALKGTGYCNNFTSCTAAVVSKEGSNLANAQVWSLWSDLDNGGFNFPRSMMNTPLPGAFGGNGQLTSGVGVNASIGYGNYNAGFASVKMNDWHGLTAQSNFTWSKALGTGALVQATSEFTPNDAFNLDNMYGRQFFDRKFVYNFFMVYQPPFFKGQSGALGRILGGWTFAPVFTAGSGQPIEVFTTTGDGQEFGAGDNVNFFGLENAVPNGPIPGGVGSAHYFPAGITSTAGSGGLPISIFGNPQAAFNDFRDPILGFDKKDGPGVITGLPYWNLDFSIRKNVKVTEQVALEFQGVFSNILNHSQLLDPWGMGLFNSGGFGNLLGQNTNPWQPRAIELGARVRF